MSFILKNTIPTSINIKLTNLGRQLLSQGKLKMTKWAVGDSEIDYSYNKELEVYNTGLTGASFNSRILRPKDIENRMISHIMRDSNDPSSIYTNITSLVSSENYIIKTAKERGFFNSQSNIFSLNKTLMKQPDMRIQLSQVTGGTLLTLKKSPSYGSIITEPVVGDYVFVKWCNPIISNGSVDLTVSGSTPQIWYKIEDIISGTLSTNNLKVKVDKFLPHFNGQGVTTYAGAFLYPNNNNRLVSGDSVSTYYTTQYVTDFIEEDVIKFSENAIVATKDVPIWNMCIVFKDEIAGVREIDRKFFQFPTRFYGGFVRYIQQLDNTIKRIGIIHFTNGSPANLYGESFESNTAKIYLPTIMWHFETGSTIGLTLTCKGFQKTLPNLATKYFDLADKYGNVVGKVFNELKIFVIEDQELLFAMSYKSNRNWTLPKPAIGLNFNTDIVNVCDEVLTCSMSLNNVSLVNESDVNSLDGSITLTVTGAVGLVLYSINGGSSYQSTNVFNNLAGNATYNVVVVDSGIGNCVVTQTVYLPRD